MGVGTAGSWGLGGFDWVSCVSNFCAFYDNLIWLCFVCACFDLVPGGTLNETRLFGKLCLCKPGLYDFVR